jgi:uncharacterized integral membrane protein
MKPKAIVIVVLIVLLVIVTIQNVQEVSFRIFFWRMAMPQIIFVPLAVFLGFFLGYIVGRADRKRRAS